MTIEELRVLITAKTEGLQDGINKAKQRLGGFKETSEATSNTVNQNIQKMKEQYDSLIQKLDNVNAQAMLQQKKLTQLREQYDRASDYGVDTPKAMKLQEKILATEARLQRLIATSDKTAESIWKLDDSFSGSGNNLEKLRDRAAQATEKTKNLSKSIRETGNSATRSSSKISGFANTISKSFTRVLKRLFIFNLIYKAIRGMISYMNGALSTNNQYINSLNTIKTNLKVAFQPIYDFILPAIQALMRALATFTGYIASFTSALFGKTYAQSFKAAKGIETAKKEMDGYGGAAKKAGKEAKGALAGFDEINTLDIKDDSDSGSGGSGHELEMPDLTQIDEGPITRLKKLLAELFQPFKDAWANEGQNTIKSAKNALNSMKELINEVGKSFKDVWTGGSGQEILERLLRILQQVFDLVANIADSFKNAWAEDNAGTKIVQELANILSIVLGIIESIGESLNKVWGEVGQDVARTFMEILGATVGILKALADGLKSVWDNGGQHLFESLVRLGAKIFELAGYIYTEFVAPFVEWFIELIAPAIGKVVDWVADLLDRFSELIDWLLGDGKPVLDQIVEILGAMAIAFGLGKGALGVFKGAILALTSPIGLTVLAVGTIIAILIGLWKTNEEFRDNVKKIWEQVKELYKVSTELIKNIISATFDKIGELWDKHGDKIKGATKIIWDTVGNIVNSVLKTIQGLLDVFIGLFTGDWERMGEGIKKIWQGMWGVLKAQVQGAWGLISPAFSTLGKSISGWFTGIVADAKNWGKNLISNFTDGISSMLGKVKDASRKVADTVKDFLGFASPTKEGPGSQADKWMPNLMNMLADGIEDNVYKVSGAVNVTAESLRGVAPENSSNSRANQIASSMGGSGTTGDTNIVIKIGEDTILDKVISGVNRESRRNGQTVITV